jgi:aspartate racemase
VSDGSEVGREAELPVGIRLGKSLISCVARGMMIAKFSAQTDRSRMQTMIQSEHFGLVGGLGVGATVLYYQGIVEACGERNVVPRLTMANAHAPTALAFVQAGRIEDLAAYLAGFVGQLAASGAAFFAIPAITPHICLTELKRQVTLPIVDILQVTAERLRERRLSRVALFGTKFTIDRNLFGALDAFDIVHPQEHEVVEIHRIYLALATQGQISAHDEAKLRELAHTLCRRERVEAIVLAGTDLNLLFNEANAGFSAVDCAAAHIDAIVARMSR